MIQLFDLQDPGMESGDLLVLEVEELVEGEVVDLVLA